MRTIPMRLFAAFAAAVFGGAALLFSAASAGAAEPSVGLGRATPFVVLAGSTVTNTGPTIVSGSLGVSPGSAMTGWPPGVVQGGTAHSADAVADGAQTDMLGAWVDAKDRSTNFAVSADLAGQRLVGGVYTGPTLSLNGTLTLDAEGVPSTVWIFQAGSTLITGSNSTVSLVNGANPCNVFWQVGSSATLGTGTTFVGTVMALTSITATTGATVAGRLFAHNGAVTLDSNLISSPDCSVAATTTTAVPDTTTTVADTTTTAPTTTTTIAVVPDTTTTTAVVVDTTTTTAVPGTTSTTAAPGPTTTVPATTTTAVPDAPTTTAAPGTTTTTAGSQPVIAATTTTIAGTGGIVGIDRAAPPTSTTVAPSPLPTTVPRPSTTQPAPRRLTGTPTGTATPTGPGTPARIDTPTGTATPTAPGTPQAPGTPGTPVPELPRTGTGTTLVLVVATSLLLLGGVCLGASRSGRPTL